MNICSPTGKYSAQLQRCLFPGNICKLCQSINKQNSLLFFIFGSCKCYGQSTASIGNFFYKCCKSLGNLSNIPSSCWAEPCDPCVLWHQRDAQEQRVSGGAGLWSLRGDVILFLALCTLENTLHRVLSAAAAHGFSWGWGRVVLALHSPMKHLSHFAAEIMLFY